MYGRILVPLDGSDTAAAALGVVETIPSERVQVLLVVPERDRPFSGWLTDSGWERWRLAQEQDARAYLERVAAPLCRQGRRIDATVAFGDPAEQILAAAEAADLIVMASRGRGTGGRALYGSIADRVVRHAPVPTLIVRGGERPVAAPPLGRIVVPLDGSSLAEDAVPVATELANQLGLPLHLISVVDVELIRETALGKALAAELFTADRAAVTRRAEDYLAAQEKRLRAEDIAVTSEVRSGSPAAALLEAIRPGDLVVLTTHGFGGVRRWLLGSVAEQLVRSAPAPVLLIRAATGSRDATAAVAPGDATALPSVASPPSASTATGSIVAAPPRQPTHSGRYATN